MSSAVRRYFDKGAEGFDAIYHGKGRFGQWIDRHFRQDMYERYRLTFETCGNVKGKAVLDIGCGSGRYSVEFARRGAAYVVGIDFAPNMLALARQHAKESGVQDCCEFILGDFLEVEFENNFNICVAIGIFDYVAKPQPFLEKMRASTSEWLIASFPSKSLIRTAIRKVRYRFKSCPLYFYDGGDIQSLLSGMGEYRIIKIPGQGMDYFVSVRVC